jgi:antitoxin (DNA-binding transcriptional repressor) of toxin-antitoxin stability system
MKVVGLEEATLDGCVRDAQADRIVITRDGKPVALIVGINGLDQEQVELGSAPFWALVTERRAEKRVSRSRLEEQLKAGG